MRVWEAFAVVARVARTRPEPWSPAELGVLLQAVEPLDGPTPPDGSVTVRDRAVEITALPDDGRCVGHGALVAAGRLAAGLEIAMRGLGWEPRREVADTADAAPLIRVTATRRRPAAPLALARHRMDRRLREGTVAGLGRPDLAQVVDVAHGASTARTRVVLANGPSRDGAPSWRTPGTPVPEAAAVSLPWRRDPVLAVCTRGDGIADQVAGGVAAHRAVVTAGLRGLCADVHSEPLATPGARAAWGRRLAPRDGRVQALVHLHD